MKEINYNNLNNKHNVDNNKENLVNTESLNDNHSPKEILYISFNYNASYFNVGTDTGFSVYKTEPLTFLFSRYLEGGISLVKMLCKSNIFALVGGGKSPAYPPNKVILWDDKKGKIAKELRLNNFVLNCHIKNKYLFVVTDNLVTVFSLENFNIIDKFCTVENEKGISAISDASDKFVFGWLDINKTFLCLKDYNVLNNEKMNIPCNEAYFYNSNDNDNNQKDKENNKEKEGELNKKNEEKGIFDDFTEITIEDVKKAEKESQIEQPLIYKNIDNKINLLAEGRIVKIKAHENNIEKIAINYQGTKVATASIRGTVIRIFETKNGNFIQELIRGSNIGTIFNICFNFDSKYLAVTSDQGTGHIFKIKNEELSNNNKNNNIKEHKNAKSVIFSGEWSFAKFKMNHNCSSEISFIDFDNMNKIKETVKILDYQGNISSASFEDSGENCKILNKNKFLL